MEEFESPVLRLLLKFDGLQAVADALGNGVQKQNVRYWVNNDYIPPEYWRKVSQLLGIGIEELLDHAEHRARMAKGGKLTRG
jgi:hypothetical protein